MPKTITKFNLTGPDFTHPSGQASMPAELIELSKLDKNPKTQLRASIDPRFADEYSEIYAVSPTIKKVTLPPPPLVGRLPDGTLLIVDGWQRITGAEKAQRTHLECIVQDFESLDKAILHACGMNETHGARRTAADRAKAVLEARRLLPNANVRQIEQITNVSKSQVANILNAAAGILPKPRKRSKPKPSESVQVGQEPVEQTEESSDDQEVLPEVGHTSHTHVPQHPEGASEPQVVPVEETEQLVAGDGLQGVAASQALVDGDGKPVPEPLLPAFQAAQLLRQAELLRIEMSKKILEAAKILSNMDNKGTKEVAKILKDSLDAELEDLHGRLTRNTPHHVCPTCDGAEGGCTRCKFRGWVPK